LRRRRLSYRNACSCSYDDFWANKAHPHRNVLLKPLQTSSCPHEMNEAHLDKRPPSLPFLPSPHQPQKVTSINCNKSSQRQNSIVQMCTQARNSICIGTRLIVSGIRALIGSYWWKQRPLLA